MPIQSFNITNVKIIKRAECEKVPRLMVIAGPNGVGKSTLLNELRRLSERVKGSGKILYVAPHRTWRKRKLRTLWLWGQERDYSTILASESVPGFEGLPIQDSSRRPDSADEALGFIKYILAQIETRRQNAITAQIDRNDLKYPEGFAPDIYKPLKDMISSLLPHLYFQGVDQKNRDDVRCILKVQGENEPVDIDDLSSGEKEIIALFMPLLEREIRAIISKVERGETPAQEATPDTVMLIDEPDLHIHSVLQKRMIEYMRQRASRDNVQFIIATHSPIIINEATSEELFVIVEKRRAQNENQIRRVLSSQEKLDLFKSVCGDVAILTLGRPIVFIEGKNPEDMKNTPSDQRILELLWKEARDFTFIPMGGKGEVEQATLIMNQIITEKLIGFPAYAIVDADFTPAISSPSILRWEFCTIENALLDPLSIFEVLEPYKEKAGVFSKEDIEKELSTICEETMRDEVDKRVKAFLPSFHLYFKGDTTEKLVQERNGGMERLRSYFANQDEVQKTEAQIQKIREDVKAIVSNKTALARFNGKVILGKFYDRKVAGKSIDMGFEVFCYSIAEKIGKNGRTPEPIKRTLTSIKQYISKENLNVPK
jgi:hypothetical protein